MTIVLGIDPGLSKIGWGVVNFTPDEPLYISSGFITTSTKDCLSQRLKKIHDFIVEVVHQFSPQSVVLEKIFVNTNPGSSLNFAYARGAIMLSLVLNNLKIQELSPNTVKKRLSGNGHATKEQIKYMVQKILNISLDDKNSDVYDALALAICST